MTCHVGTLGYVNMGTSEHGKKWTRGHVDIVRWTRTARKIVHHLIYEQYLFKGSMTIDAAFFLFFLYISIW